MRAVLWVALAGAAGALSRWGLGAAVNARFPDFPWATLVINVSGSFVLGFLFVVLTQRVEASPALRTAVMTGFLGAYTTFSTFTVETIRLVEDGAVGRGLTNVLLSVVLGLAAAWLGWSLGRAV